MSKENEDISNEDIGEVPDITTSVGEDGADTTDWKAIAEANRELAIRNQGIAKRFKTKLEKAKDRPEPSSSTEKVVETKKSSEVDFTSGDKALLRSFDIKGADEIALAKNWMQRYGDEIDVMAENEVFQSKLKSLRESKASIDATPKGTRRGTQTSSNDVQSWVDKINSGQAKSSDIEDVQLRRQVLNKRIEDQRSGSRFSANGIIMK